MNSTPFTPVFCPNCGTCVNLPEEDVHPFDAPVIMVNCGWCHGRHSIDQVKTCRRLGYLSEQQRLAGIEQALLNRRATLVDE